jgi:hypothetical protein
MTTKADFYGSDDDDNVFPLTGSDKKYFTLVNKKTGEVEVWQDNPDGFLRSDKRIGNINPETGQIEYNGTWFSNVSKKDRQLVNDNLGTIKDQSINTAKLGIKNEKGITAGEAENQANKLLNNNKAFMDDTIQNALSKPASIEEQKKMIGEAEAGTREQPDSFGVHVFPQSLRMNRGGQDFMKIDMMAYQARSLQQGIKKGTLGLSERSLDRTTLGSVILPIPGAINDSQQVKWNEDSINPFQLAVANIALTMIEQDIGSGIDVASSAVQTALNTPDTKKALGTYIGGMASQSQNLLQRTTGAVMNPNMELLFNGPQLRNFSFAFTLAPRNKKEAMDVVKIIRFFKQGMAPIRSKSRLFLKSPHTFRIAYKQNASEASRSAEFGVNDHPYLNKFKECALRSFGVNYTPNGTYSTYEDGVMTAYQITMNFNEMSPIYNDDYGNNGSLPSEIGF